MNIEAKELSKIYGSGESRVVALDKVSLEIASSDFISIMGPSGSGKSTLLHLLSGLDKPTSGSLTYDGKDIYRFNDKELSSFRRRRIGFIFQQFNLLPVLTAKENIIMPLLLDKKQPDEVYLNQLTDLLGIRERLTHLPHELSGGQQQRVAIALRPDRKAGYYFSLTNRLEIWTARAAARLWKCCKAYGKKIGENACYHHSRQPHCKNGRPAICNCGRCSFGGDSKMKSYLALAWKELKAQKITAILILVAVIMSTIMTTVIGQSIGMLQSMRIQQAAGLNGNRYATFHQLGKEQAQKLHEDDRLYDVGDTIFIGSTPLGNSSLSLYLQEYHDNALSMYPAIGNVKEGRLPEEAMEIALSEDALQYLGLDAVIGGTVSLDLSVSVMDGSLPELEYSADFVLTGILESSYIGYASGTVEGIVGEGTAEELLPEEYLLYSTDFKTYDKQNFQSIIYALAEDLNVDERYIQYNWVLLDAIGISYDEAADSDTGTGFSFMTAACILVGVLVLLAAGLVIYNILKISITKRIKEYGTLRAIGGERGQIYRLVSLAAF